MPDFATFKRWVTADWRAHGAWRSQAKEDFAFVAGDQWTVEEKQLLEDQNRVPIVFNRCATIINAVAGSEINNRTEVRYIPRTLGDAEVNEVLTKGAEWFRDQSDAEDADSQAFWDSLVCGLGWTETLLDFESDTDGEPRVERINPLEMCWDGSAEKRCLTDARRFARVREVSIDEARDLFPDVAEEELSAKWMDRLREGDEDEPTRQWSDDDYSHEDDGDVVGDNDKPRTVTLVQLQYRERRRDVEYIDPLTGQKGTLPKRQFARLMDGMRKQGYDPKIENREISRWEWKQVFLGGVVLEENQPCRDASTFVPITAYWDNAKRQWFGLLRQMRDPQKFANKWLSQTLHIINSNSKGGVIAEQDAVDDHRRFEEEWAAADSVVWARGGALAQGKIQPKPQAQMPAALMSLTEFAITSIRDTSGVNQELLGLREVNQPGILESQRKQAAMTTLAVLFDALRQYRKAQGKVLLFYMTEYLADGRLIRIADEDGERYEPLRVDASVQKYDVIVDDAPQSPNNKEKVWETVIALLPMLRDAGLPKELWAEIIAYSPFPESLVQKLQEFAQQPDPQQEQAQKMAMQKAQAEIEGEKADAFATMAKGQKDVMEAQMVPMERAQQVIDMLAKLTAPAQEQQRFDAQQQLERERMLGQQVSESRQLSAQERMAQMRGQVPL